MRTSRAALALACAWLIAVALVGCLKTETVLCHGYTCPVGTRCGTPELRCIDPQQSAACADKPDRESCSFPALGDGNCIDGLCVAAVVSVDRPSVRNAAAMAYDAVRRRVVVFGGSGLTGDLDDTWELQHEAPLQPIEACALATADDDQDGLAGCNDPDCWGRCAPMCPPGATCPATAPRCGDATCAAVEDPFLCPADCP